MNRLILVLLLAMSIACKQENKSAKAIAERISTQYDISFENAVHHEATVKVTFSNLTEKEVEIRMSRTSPGRYALHEFVKNIYNVNYTDGSGNSLEAIRADPYSWIVSGHDGTINLSYTLFANRGGGTYAQIDETHAHLNIPATFMYAPILADEGIEVTFNKRDDLNWKVATQLKPLKGNTYYAPNLQYFMDSPTEISDHAIRTFELDGQSINFVLHHNGTDAEFDAFFEQVKPIVYEQKAVYGELPQFDYGAYYFLACYIPNASGDGMEHRNSTILTSTRALADGGMDRNIGTVSHEFFHAWNVERIRPQSLEPFDFEEANMSGELWFAEGFTSYYTGLILCRAGISTPEQYITGLSGTLNYVWNSPGRQFFNPIEMSYQAPFVDAARSVDPVNRDNTFISYYSYGSALGLALDLSLREQGLNLDDYMKSVWTKFGKSELPYTITDLQNLLSEYASQEFSDAFFKNFIYESNMPDMQRLLGTVGVELSRDTEKAWFGSSPSNGMITRNTLIGSPAYKAGLENGDLVIAIGEHILSESYSFEEILKKFKPNDKAKVVYERLGKQRETEITFAQDPRYSIALVEANGRALSDVQKLARDSWLNPRVVE
ncbi:MAG: M61 family metallopeptidase [Flavobacteriaceae bacterium]|nr:M61 family metallopeptidase [Flavobacteriaceae bacterium]